MHKVKKGGYMQRCTKQGVENQEPKSNNVKTKSQQVRTWDQRPTSWNTDEQQEHETKS